MNINIGIRNLNEVLQRIAAIGKATDNFRSAWADCAAKFYGIERNQFGSEGARSNKWAQLTPAYAEWKARNYPGKKILQREGRLIDSLVTNNADSIRIEEDRRLRIGTSVPYAIFHQNGTQHMAKRQPIDMTDGDIREFRLIIQAHLAQKIEQSGGRINFVDLTY